MSKREIALNLQTDLPSASPLLMKIAGPLISLSTVLMLFLVELRQSGREPLRAKNVGLRGCSTGIPGKISSFSLRFQDVCLVPLL